MSKVRLLLEMTKVMVTAICNGVCFLYFVGITEDMDVKDVHADAFVHFDSNDPTYVNGGFVGHLWHTICTKINSP